MEEHSSWLPDSFGTNKYLGCKFHQPHLWITLSNNVSGQGREPFLQHVTSQSLPSMYVSMVGMCKMIVFTQLKKHNTNTDRWASTPRSECYLMNSVSLGLHVAAVQTPKFSSKLGKVPWLCIVLLGPVRVYLCCLISSAAQKGRIKVILFQ